MPRRGLAAALTLTFLLAFRAGPFSQQDRVAGILARAREAIGGEARLKAVQSLSFTADVARQTAGSVRFAYGTITPLDHLEESYRVEVKILLPDKFVVDTRFGVTRDGFNGPDLIAEAHGQPRRVVGPNARQHFAELRHQEFLRYVLALLLEAPQEDGVRFSDGGVAQFDGAPVDVVDATGTYGLAVRLFFDGQGRLLALKDRVPPLRPLPSQPVTADKTEHKDDPLIRTLEAPPIEDARGVQMRLGDYRTVDGISLPHRVTIVSDGYDHQEWQIKRFKVNGKINPKDFNPSVPR